jgi:hypothetical protein
MKALLKFLPIIFCFLLMAAHLSRAGLIIPMVICLLFPSILFWRSKLSVRIMQVTLVIFGLEWIRTLIYYARIRIENGEDWLRLALILGTVALINFATILIYRSKYMRKRYKLRL